MKKSLIVTGAASLALAAMPLADVFADNPPYTKNTVTDILNVRVLDSCSLSATPGSGGGDSADPATVNTIDTLQNYTVTYYGTTADAISNGQTKNYTATTIKVICNDASGWMVNAVGASQTGQGLNNASTINSMAPSLGTSHPIVTGTSGDGSYWAMKLTTPDGTLAYPAIIKAAFQDWAEVPSSLTKVAYGPMTDTTVSSEVGHVGEISGTGSEFITNYKVHIGANQEADTYTGKVTYTLVHPNDTTTDNPAQQP